MACAKQPQEPSILPEGRQEISGYLLSAELSLVRRGTHLLLEDGIERYFVESKTIALQTFEGKEVTAKGFLEQNIEPSSLPVLIIEEIQEREDPWKKTRFDSLGLTLQIPPKWVVEQSHQGVLFHLPSSRHAIVQILQEESAPPSGTSIRIGNRIGVRILNEQSGEQKIVIPFNDSTMFITFIPQDPEHLVEERAMFLRLLHSIEWHEQPENDSSAASSKDYGAPCGGSAGVLCPTGFYCEVKDFKEGIGKCVKI